MVCNQNIIEKMESNFSVNNIHVTSFLKNEFLQNYHKKEG